MRLIDADALIYEIIEAKQGYIASPNEVVLHDLMCDNAVAWADGAETVEAVPAVHGKWVKHGSGKRCCDYSCIRCKCVADYDFNYCPNCGAKMDEV